MAEHKFYTLRKSDLDSRPRLIIRNNTTNETELVTENQWEHKDQRNYTVLVKIKPLGNGTSFCFFQQKWRKQTRQIGHFKIESCAQDSEAHNKMWSVLRSVRKILTDGFGNEKEIRVPSKLECDITLKMGKLKLVVEDMRLPGDKKVIFFYFLHSIGGRSWLLELLLTFLIDGN